MLMFITEKTKNDFEHILVLTDILVHPWQQSGMLTVDMFAQYHHWPNMSKMQPLDLHDGLSCGEKCSKNLYVQTVYYEMCNSFCTANLLYRLPQSFLLRGRRSKHAQSQQVCQNSLSKLARKKAPIPKMSTSRWRYVQIPGNSVFCSLRYNTYRLGACPMGWLRWVGPLKL